jgi:hypothetical protein
MKRKEMLRDSLFTRIYMDVICCEIQFPLAIGAFSIEFFNDVQRGLEDVTLV